MNTSMTQANTVLIFDKKNSKTQLEKEEIAALALSSAFLREKAFVLPDLAELDVVRHYTLLSQKNFSIDTHFYPLGSCTMKYNPRAVDEVVSYPGFTEQHPLAEAGQGVLACLFELQDYLAALTGMHAVCLSPMAGAQGEFAGVAMIKAYHAARGDNERCEILIPDAAHGTNPASAAMSGFRVKEIPTKADGDIDVDRLLAALGPQTAGIMLTNPSTLGVFERDIQRVAEKVHQAGGLLYYDGANLNAILGKVRPGDMGFDIVHLNLHKTFATPHGGGGPGAGPIAVSQRLLPYLPVPRIKRLPDNRYTQIVAADQPESIGQLSAFMGNVGILLRAYAYIRLIGQEGMQRISAIATLNANYLQKKLAEIGYVLAFPNRRATHEFIVTIQPITKKTGVTAMDIAKRLLDFGIHAPTTYFPLLIPECLLIEPTETESKETLDRFIAVMAEIYDEAHHTPETLKTAPHNLALSRLDDVRAVKQLDVAWT